MYERIICYAIICVFSISFELPKIHMTHDTFNLQKQSAYKRLPFEVENYRFFKRIERILFLF